MQHPNTSPQILMASEPGFMREHGDKSPLELVEWANECWAGMRFRRAWIQCVAARMVVEGFAKLRDIPEQMFEEIVDLTDMERKYLPR